MKKIRPKSCLIVLLGGIVLLALVVYLCIPYAPRTAAELCGTYVLDCELVEQQLTLFPDGTFTQVVTVKSTSEAMSSKGKWRYDTRTKNGATFGDVTFDAFMAVLQWPDELKPDYAHPHPGIAVLPAEYWFGQLILGGRVDSWPDWKKIN